MIRQDLKDLILQSNALVAKRDALEDKIHGMMRAVQQAAVKMEPEEILELANLTKDTVEKCFLMDKFRVRRGDYQKESEEAFRKLGEEDS